MTLLADGTFLWTPDANVSSLSDGDIDSFMISYSVERTDICSLGIPTRNLDPIDRIVLAIDDDTIDNGILSIQQAAAAAGVTTDVLINDINPVEVGNPEFRHAEKSLREVVEAVDLPEAGYFLETFAPSFRLTLDELG